MLDKDLCAEVIGIVKTSPTVTIMKVSNELQINQEKAKEILDQLEDLVLIVNFGDFYACTDLAELN